MTKQTKQKRLYFSLLFVSTVVFVWSAVLAAQKQFFPLERHIFLNIYNLPGFLHIPMALVTQFGSAVMLLILGIYFLIGHKRSQARGQQLLVNGLIVYGLVELSKYAVARARPNVLLSGISQRELIKLHDFGFPSGHTALATIMSLTIVRYLPHKWRWLPLLWIPAVAVSRIYLGVHAPLDIVGGFTLALSVFCAEQLLHKKPKIVTKITKPV